VRFCRLVQGACACRKSRSGTSDDDETRGHLSCSTRDLRAYLHVLPAPRFYLQFRSVESVRSSTQLSAVSQPGAIAADVRAVVSARDTLVAI
jgi:hypothetical protein